MIKIYKDIDKRISILEGVSEGFPTDYTVSRTGDLISIFKKSLNRYEVADADYTFILDKDGNGFPNAGDTESYLITVFSGFGASTETNITKIMDCDVSLSVGDWVFQSTTINNRAETPTDNNPDSPIIGRVVDKPSTTQATIVLIGIVNESEPRGRIFLGSTGGSAVTPPTIGFIQRLGVSFGDGQMMLNPELHRVKKI